jgi:biotin operon repressor
MKQYKLAAWPELPATYHRTVYRRMLSDMSHRYMSPAELTLSSGATKVEVRQFLQSLEELGVLVDREGDSDSFYDTTLRPVGDWFRTVFGADQKI